MWIRKKDYESLKKDLSEARNRSHELAEFKAKAEAATTGLTTIMDNNVLVTPMSVLEEISQKEREYKAQLDIVLPELERYKQMYADEVQKRLDLISKMSDM